MAPGRGAYRSVPLKNISLRTEQTLLVPDDPAATHPQDTTSERWWQRKREEGWRSGVLFCASCASLVFLLNLVLTVWSIARHGWGGKEARQILFEGSCEKSSRLNTGLHLLINTLS